MIKLRSWQAVAVLACAAACAGVEAAEMSVGNVLIRPNGAADVVVSGTVAGESTFGWTIVLELVPRPGSVGVVEFTAASARAIERRGSFVVERSVGHPDSIKLVEKVRPDVDIRQLGDVWPQAGNFSAYDTQRSGSKLLNGAVDENGTFLASPVSFSGPLVRFPIVSSPKARGIWDVVLRTSSTSSGWAGVETVLRGGSILVDPDACGSASECADGNSCTRDSCTAGVCVHTLIRDRDCREEKPRRKRGRR